MSHQPDNISAGTLTPQGCERIKARIEQSRPRPMFESGASTDLAFGGTRAAICAPTGNMPNIHKLTTTPEGAGKSGF